MAYAQPFLQLTWGGSYFTDDIWINGLHIIADSPLGPESVVQAFNLPTVTDISGSISSTHKDVQGNSEHATLDWVKLALIGTDGKYDGDAIVVDMPGDSGGRVGTMYPQLATAFTLRGEKRRGPAAYGRYYAPMALNLNNDGTSTSAAMIGAIGFQTLMLTRINADLADNTVGNYIKLGNVSKVGAGFQEPITGVFLGNLTDTQRRRRNKLNETYIGNTI